MTTPIQTKCTRSCSVADGQTESKKGPWVCNSVVGLLEQNRATELPTIRIDGLAFHRVRKWFRAEASRSLTKVNRPSESSTQRHHTVKSSCFGTAASTMERIC